MSRFFTDWTEIYEAQPALLWTVVALGFFTGVTMVWYRRRSYSQRFREAKAKGRELRERLGSKNGPEGGASKSPPSRPAIKGVESAGLFRHAPDVPDGAAPVTPDRIAFVMDVSRSLTPAQFSMSKAELLCGVESLSHGTLYQVIFFSGPVWFAHQRLVSGGERGEDVVIRDSKLEHRWKYAFGGHHYEGGDAAHPVGEWRIASVETLEATRLDIEAVGKSDGTTWHLPLLTALHLEPAPSQVFFMTDGEIARQDEVIGEILGLSSERGNPVIHTTSLMVPGASKSLHRLSTATGGRHALVIAGGHVLRDQELVDYLEEKGITLDEEVR
jgi:hypothetical protein